MAKKKKNKKLKKLKIRISTDENKFVVVDGMHRLFALRLFKGIRSKR